MMLPLKQCVFVNDVLARNGGPNRCEARNLYGSDCSFLSQSRYPELTLRSNYTRRRVFDLTRGMVLHSE